MSTTASVPEFHIGDRLGKALDVSGISVATMAIKLGVSRQTIGNYLAGRTTPKLAIVKVWAEETGVDLGWLQEGTPRIHAPSASEQLDLFQLAA